MTGVKNIGASFDGSGEMPEDRGTAIGDRIRDCVSLDGRIAFVKKYAQDEKVMRVVLEHFPTLFPYADPSLRKKKSFAASVLHHLLNASLKNASLKDEESDLIVQAICGQAFWMKHTDPKKYAEVLNAIKEANIPSPEKEITEEDIKNIFKAAQGPDSTDMDMDEVFSKLFHFLKKDAEKHITSHTSPEIAEELNDLILVGTALLMGDIDLTFFLKSDAFADALADALSVAFSKIRI